MTELAHPVDLRLSEQLQDRNYRKRFFWAELSARIAEQLISLRKRRGLTQTEVADLTGTKQPAISRAEQADYQNWNLKTLRSIAEALDARVRVTIEASEDVISEYESKASQPSEEQIAIAEEPVCNFITLVPARQGIANGFVFDQTPHHPNLFGVPVSGVNNVFSTASGGAFYSGGMTAPWAANCPIPTLSDPTKVALLQRVDQLEKLLAEKGRENRKLSKAANPRSISEGLVPIEFPDNPLQNQRGIPAEFLVQ
jgi:transcriptional regulator with XRE-family HTH domain